MKFKVTAIGKNAFKGCKKLKTVTVKSASIKKVDKTAFKGTSKKLVVKISAQVAAKMSSKKKKIYMKLFKNVKIK